MLGAGPGEAAQDGVRFSSAQPQRSGVLDHLVVLVGDELPADWPGEDGGELGPVRSGRVLRPVEALRPEILEPGHELEAQQLAEGEPDRGLAVGVDVVRGSGRIGTGISAKDMVDAGLPLVTSSTGSFIALGGCSGFLPVPLFAGGLGVTQRAQGAN